MEITEIDELAVKTVSGVETPASGYPFLLLKSAAAADGVDVVSVPAQEAWIDQVRKSRVVKGGPEAQPCETCDGSGRVKVKGRSKLAECSACGGSGQCGVVKSDSVESDRIVVMTKSQAERHNNSGGATKMKTAAVKVKKSRAVKPRAVKKAASGESVTAAVTAAVTGALSGVRSRRVAKSDSAESDRMQLTVTGTGDALAPVRHHETGRFLPKVTESVKSAPANVQAAARVLRDPAANQVAKRIASSVVKSWAEGEGSGNNGEVMPEATAAVDASDIGAVFSDVDEQYVSKMQRLIASPVATPEQKEQLGAMLTKALLEASHAPASSALSKATLTAADEGPIGRLRELVKSKDLDPTLRQEVGALLTRHDLAKGAIEDQITRVTSALTASDQRAGTTAAVRGAQARSVADQQPVAGLSSEGQVRTIGSGNGVPASLGQARMIGNSKGYLTGAQGRTEPAPIARVIEQTEDELECCKSADEASRLGETLTYLKLRAAREGVAVAA
jgi:hypothetical protein